MFEIIQWLENYLGTILQAFYGICNTDIFYIFTCFSCYVINCDYKDKSWIDYVNNFRIKKYKMNIQMIETFVSALINNR